MGGYLLFNIEFPSKEDRNKFEQSLREALDIVVCMNKDEDDRFTGGELLQFCLYGEVIYG